MKIAVSSDSDNAESANVDPRFGRCRYFLICNTDDGSFAVEKNEHGSSGAGIASAKKIAELGCDAVITGNLGPNALDALTQFEISAYKFSGSILDAVKNIDSLEKISGTDETGPGAGSGNGDPISENKTGENNTRGNILIPLDEDNERLSGVCQHFGHAPYLGVYYPGEDRFDVIKNEIDHSHENPLMGIVEKYNLRIVYALGIGRKAIDFLESQGIEVLTGEYTVAKEVIENLGSLKTQTNSCKH